MSVVTLVNIKILTSTHTYSFWSFFLTIGSILVFVLFFFLLSLWPTDEIYMEFLSVFGSALCYFSLFFVGGALVLVDNGLHLTQYEIAQLIESKETAKEKRM